MANRSLPDLPYASSAVDGDIFHINQDGVDKQLSGFSLAEHVLRTSAFARVSIDVHAAYVLTLANPKDVDITANAAATNYSITLPAAAAALAPTRVTISRKGVAAGTITIIIPGHTSVVLSAEEDFAIVSCQKTGASAYSWIVLSRTQTPQEVLAKWQASDPFAPYSVAKRTIPGSDDDVLTVLNTQVGKPHSILEVMAPAGSTAEATLSLHAVASDIDWVFDYSLHNYSGSMKGVFVLSVFNEDTKTQMQWVFKRRPTGSSGYGTTEDYYMMQLSEDGELEINVAGVVGPTPDWKRVLTTASNCFIDGVAEITEAQLDTAESPGVYRVTYVGGTKTLLVFGGNPGGSVGAVQLLVTYNGDVTRRNKVDGTTWNAWKTLIDSGNIGSQSVASATTATTALKIRTSAPVSPAAGDIWME